MAAPVLVGVGSGAFSATSPVVVTKTGCVAGNLVIVTCMVLPGVGNSPSFSSSVSNITSLGGVANTLNQFASGGSFELAATAGRIGVRFGRVTANGTVSVSVTNAGGLDGFARIYEFANVEATGTTPEAICENSGLGLPDQSAATSATVTAALVTTTGADRLAVALISLDDDLTIGPFTGESGADWTEPVAEYSDASGEQGTLQIQTATMPTAGSITGGSVTASGSSNYSVLAFALLPDTSLAFPSTGLLDQFNRANEDPLAGIWAGPCFTGDRQVRLLSNELAPHSVDAYGNSYISGTTYGPDCEMYCTLTSAFAASATVEFFLRGTFPSDPANWYKIRFRNSAGDFEAIVTLDDVSIGSSIDIEPNTEAAGDGFGVRIVDNVIYCYWKAGSLGWNPVGSRTDVTNTHPGAGRLGIGIVGSAVRIDDVGGGTVGGEEEEARVHIAALGAIGW